MMFERQSVRVVATDVPGVHELCFDRQGESVNKFDNRTVTELQEATRFLKAQPDLRGVLVTSAKDVFIVGADITEFGEMFSQSAADIAADVLQRNAVFVEFEDLPVPTVVAINGFALGGGLEFAMANSIRVMSTAAQIGVPEVKLGLFPGFGGTVRLVRQAGPAVACEWVSTGKPAKAEAALAAGVVDDIAAPEALRAKALEWLRRAIDGGFDWQASQQRKRDKLAMPQAQADAAFAEARANAARGAAPHQPAALAAIDMMRAGAGLDQRGALELEAGTFGEIARTQAAVAMVRTFLNELAVKKAARRQAKGAPPVRQAAVLGAGIMGGGIAFASALKGVPVRMKDISRKALDQGMDEARKQVGRQLKSGRLSEAKAAAVLASIQPQIDDAGFDAVDLVVEAIVEKLEVKQKVLAEIEAGLKPGTVIASNTSSLRIDDIATALQRPEDLVGMHFFNPVPMMPLVEVVKGAKTSDAAVAAAVGYAAAMGKTPIVVKDCPGFLVNRVFTAYMRGFLQLVADGGDFVKIDAAMEAFGWPMGPAYLEDVIGMDTGSHVNDVISAGYPQRMPAFADDALRLMARAGRFGQKSGFGFYRYEPNAQGKPRRVPAGDTHVLLAPLQKNGPRDFTPVDIVDRLMLPMVVEASHALEEGVVGTPAELDMALLMGLGFPAYAGGPLQYADWLGLAEVVARCDRLAALGPAFRPTERMRAMAASGARFH
ncbi:MAG: fatty acid oxidation complex subunit alpha FadB [Pseudomonadota bacterium]